MMAIESVLCQTI
ncbi:unnamed protein product [Linum tenue]|uniref:Uncharacterized protein n=1 Tax=Linum tenue TaxID=586396 RepID=A0AAV0NIA4_9ROSI|nr:unnamed protein product [Linum tenue]